MFEQFVRKGAIIVRYFQKKVNTQVFKSLYEDFGPNIDYNSTYSQVVNDHYICDISEIDGDSSWNIFSANLGKKFEMI